MQEDYDAIAPAFNESRYNMHWPEVNAMIDAVPSGSRVLDMGCGSGRVCRFFGEKKVDYVGIDLSEEELKLARKSCSGGKFMQGSMLDLPFEENLFDVVFMIASIQHLLTEEQRMQALQESMRVLKPSGILNVTVKAFWQLRYRSLFLNKKKGKETLSKELQKELKWSDIFWPWRWRIKNTVYRYYHAFSRRELKQLLVRAGFQIERIEYIRNGKKVKWYQGKNLVAVAKKVV